MSNSLPVIGAALPVDRLADFRDWLIEKDRDLELQSFTRAEVLEGDWQALVDEAKRQLDGHRGRIGIHGPFWGLQLDSLDADIRAVVTRRILAALDCCAALGARQMVLHSPYSAWTTDNMDQIPAIRTSVLETTHATLAPAVARAEETGVTLVIENVEDKDPAARVALAESFGSDAVKVSIDTGHAQCAHHRSGAPPVDHFVMAAGTRLDHVHLQDVDGHADRHWQIGEGAIPWPSVFRAIAALDCQPHLVLELRDYDTIPASMAWLERAGLAQ